jgi:acyl-CoA thioester hydrolase
MHHDTSPKRVLCEPIFVTLDCPYKAAVEARATFEKEFEVSSDDIDELGHASNLAYVRWILDIAVEHSNAVGLNYEAYVRLGAIFVVRRHEVDYLRPVLRGERIASRTWIATVSAAKCERATEIRRVLDNTIVAKGLTTWGFIDAKTGRPTRIPPDVRTAFGQAQRVRSQAIIE